MPAWFGVDANLQEIRSELFLCLRPFGKNCGGGREQGTFKQEDFG